MTERTADQASTDTRPDPTTDTQWVPQASADGAEQQSAQTGSAPVNGTSNGQLNGTGTARPPLAERLQRRIAAAAEERRAAATASRQAKVLPPPPPELLSTSSTATAAAPVAPTAPSAPATTAPARPAAKSSSRDAASPRRTPSKPAARGPRRARLRLSRIDPWSVMKISFLLSIAFGVVTVVSVFMVWSVLDAAGVWTSINSTVADMVSSGNNTSTFNIEDYLGTSRVLGFTMLVSVVDVVLITAIATLAAFLYNMASSLLGGIEVTLSEDPT